MLMDNEEVRKIVNGCVYQTIQTYPEGGKVGDVYNYFINALNRDLRKLDVYSDISRLFYNVY